MSLVWSELPVGRVIRIVGASPAAFALSAAFPPPDAPAIVVYRPLAARSTASVVAAALDELERAVLDLYPAWLPGAEGIPGPAGAGVPAVRALAARLAASTGHVGPFLADLAERALRREMPRSDRFPVEVRAAGLSRMVAASFGRSSAALLVCVPDGMSGGAEQALVGGGEWLAYRGGLGVWLAGAPLKTVDWLPVVPVRLPEPVARLAREMPDAVTESGLPTISYPAPEGRPHPASRAEQALEEALAVLPWAVGRAWNQTYRPHPLAIDTRLDLVWWPERCVVEIDGPEHRERLRFQADRRRDVQLQLDGYAVLRFTNAEVLHDLGAVVNRIEKVLQARRPGRSEGHRHAG